MILSTLLSILKVLVPFGVLSFIQNMAFTASSRSRNSGDPNYHRWCAYMSNGVYYITNALLTVYIIKYGALWQLALQGIVYTLTTAEGSVLMMRKMLAKEAGRRAVGAGQKALAQISLEDGAYLSRLIEAAKKSSLQGEDISLPAFTPELAEVKQQAARAEALANDAYTIGTNMCPDSGLVAMKAGGEIVTNLPTK
jgi:hypothetical protein